LLESEGVTLRESRVDINICHWLPPLGKKFDSQTQKRSQKQIANRGMTNFRRCLPELC